MDNVPLQKYQDGELTVRYIGDERVDFFFGGEVIFRKSMAQCEKLVPYIDLPLQHAGIVETLPDGALMLTSVAVGCRQGGSVTHSQIWRTRFH